MSQQFQVVLVSIKSRFKRSVSGVAVQIEGICDRATSSGNKLEIHMCVGESHRTVLLLQA